MRRSQVGPMKLPEDDERFAELLRAHHTQLFGYLYAMVRNANDAEDLYQETSVVLWSKFAEYEEGTSFFAWALATARYKLLNFQRTRKRRWQFTAELHSQLNDVFEELDPGLLEARLEALKDCKEKLPDEDRRFLDLCYGSDVSFRETADRLGRTPKSVYRMLDRIRDALLDCIERRIGDPGRDS